MTAETALVRRILAKPRPDVRLWRNATGTFWACPPPSRVNRTGSPVLVTLYPGQFVFASATPVKAGLCEGSADLIGIAPDARFLAVEVKTPSGVIEPHQRKFIEMVRAMGAIGGFARSVDDVDRIIAGEVLDG